MKGSFRIATAAGIGIFVHWTFLILLAWIVLAHVAQGDNLAKAAEGIAFVVSLFTCVVLHELGHALVARRFGVKTRDITLLPIGGVARLEKIPERPMHELLVAVAGPAVNLVIAGVLLVVILLAGRLGQLSELSVTGGDFLSKLMLVNLGLIVFNLLPAFPMDGGRVLRALLAMRMSRVRATHLAAAVGQVMAIGFGALGVLGGQWMLLLIAFVIYQGAQAEASAVELRAMFQGVRVRDAMITQFQPLLETDSIELAVAASSRGLQKDFPVTRHGEICGVLRHKDIIQALSAGQMNSRVADVMQQEFVLVQDSTPLNQACDTMQSSDSSLLLVVHGNALVGMLSEEHLGEWVRLHASLLDRIQAEA